ncbi:hypothetical protein OBA37_01190 [Candidatus Pelagibacter sp.]|nr:hypothetical protein [Candidatus Pelagibacter sp.]
MIKKFIFSVFALFLLASCTTYSHQSGNDSNLATDSRSCKNLANLNAPTYICRNPLMCAPDEIAIAWEAIARNDAYYDQCMLQKGYRAQ